MSLIELRLKAKMLQREVANKLDVSQAAVSHWETGDAKPCRKYRQKLARLYGVTEEELLNDM